MQIRIAHFLRLGLCGWTHIGGGGNGSTGWKWFLSHTHEFPLHCHLSFVVSIHPCSHNTGSNSCKAVSAFTPLHVPMAGVVCMCTSAPICGGFFFRLSSIYEAVAGAGKKKHYHFPMTNNVGNRNRAKNKKTKEKNEKHCFLQLPTPLTLCRAITYTLRETNAHTHTLSNANLERHIELQPNVKKRAMQPTLNSTTRPNWKFNTLANLEEYPLGVRSEILSDFPLKFAKWDVLSRFCLFALLCLLGFVFGIRGGRKWSG